VLGSVFLVYSCCVIDAKVLLQLYKNWIVCSFGLDWFGL
jgi:hypothetical protein